MVGIFWTALECDLVLMVGSLRGPCGRPDAAPHHLRQPRKGEEEDDGAGHGRLQVFLHQRYHRRTLPKPRLLNTKISLEG